jgi:hypothetical protein
MKKQNEASILLAQHLKELGIKAGTEFEFAPPRKWRFDFAFTCKKSANNVKSFTDGDVQMRAGRHSNFPDARSYKVAIEIEGGVFSKGGGRHNRGVGFTEDCIKYSHAAASGWTVFRFTTAQVLSGEAKEFIGKFLEGRL